MRKKQRKPALTLLGVDKTDEGDNSRPYGKVPGLVYSWLSYNPFT